MSHRFICFNCGKRGHYARDCRAPKQKQKQQGEKNMLAINVANTDWKNNIRRRCLRSHVNART